MLATVQRGGGKVYYSPYFYSSSVALILEEINEMLTTAKALDEGMDLLRGIDKIKSVVISKK